MTKRFLEVQEMHESARNEEIKLFFADEKEEAEDEAENEQDADIDKGGKTQA